MYKIILIILLAAGCIYNTPAQKTAVHHYLPTMNMQQAKNYVGYDLIIVDPEVPFSSPNALKWIKENNSDVRILCYVNPTEWFDPMFPDKPWSIKVVDFLKTIPEWWLRGADGQKISFWQGMQTMNCSDLCPQVIIDGQPANYVNFFADIFINNLLKNYKFDGVLIDNCWEKVFWLGHYNQNKKGVDINGDGLIEDSITVDTHFKAGMQKFIDRIVQAGGSDFIVIGNPGNAPFEISTMFEEFPCIYVNEKDKIYEAWIDNIKTASSRPGVKIFNSRKNNYFFTLCSSMLLDNVYFSYIQNTSYDEKWKLNLGEPLKPYEVSGEEYAREFQLGKIFVNPKLKKARVVYADGSVRNQ